MFHPAARCRHLTWLLGVFAVAISLGAAASGAEEGSANLPLKRVVLFSSGVGYFQHDGPVTDNAKVELKFKVENINDLLKSMVVEDQGGQVSTVNYGSKDPITKTLKSFAIDLTTNPTLGDLLNQARGEQVELDAPNKITGTILGVEKRKKEVDKEKVVEIEILNLLTADGLRAVPLDAIGRIKLTNEKLDAELRKALALLASSHSTDKKTVTLSFQGNGSRQARVGYVQETPVWKTSYRLELADKKAPFLQGWAIVENTTEEDWSGVALTLVSGRPISFTMDLYQPLYVPRPQVELELYSSLRPQVYGQDLAKKEAEFGELKAQDRAAMLGRRMAKPAEAPAKGAMAGTAGGFGFRADGRQLGEVAMEAMPPLDLQISRGVQSVAQAQNVGELFQYAIGTPVSLPRQQSAMLPIVNEEVQGEKVSIYNQGVQPKHPLNGLRLKNSTKLHLMQGPITVFDDNTYAGDAKIEDLAPGSERLISYALDLDTEVSPESKGKPQQLLAVRLIKGTLIATHKSVRTHDYTVKNSGRKAKKVLIELPLEPDWKLVAPEKPEEKARDRYRFAVEAKPGEPAKLHVEEERTDSQSIALTNIDDATIGIYLRAKVVSEKVKSALAEVIKRKAELNQVTQRRAQLQQKVNEISEEQNRIRQNMPQIDRTSDLYKRYVKKFSDQEDEIEKLRTQIQQAQAEENGLRKSLDGYLMGLDLS